MGRSRVSSILATLALLTFVACSDSAPPSSWAVVDPPTVVDETDDVVSTNATVGDGTYWAELALVSGSGDIAFRVTKARFGDACEAWARDNGLEFCANDYAVESYPDAYVAVDEDAAVSVAEPDGPETNYSINTTTLEELIGGATPLGDVVPSGYLWTPFPFVVVVADGYVVRADQLWVP
jgi:hypothetical protein